MHPVRKRKRQGAQKNIVFVVLFYFKMLDYARSSGRCLITKGAAPKLSNRFFRPARRDTRAFSPTGLFGKEGAAPLSGAGEQTARAIGAYARSACLLSLQMGSIN
jgi:hypothetical protein